jgi:hypothetical protein
MPFPDFQPSTRVAFTGGTMTFRHAPVTETAYVYMTGQFYGGRSQFVDGRPFLFAFGDAAGRTRITAVAVPGAPAYDTVRRWLTTPPTGPLTIVGLRTLHLPALFAPGGGRIEVFLCPVFRILPGAVKGAGVPAPTTAFELVPVGGQKAAPADVPYHAPEVAARKLPDPGKDRAGDRDPGEAPLACLHRIQGGAESLPAHWLREPGRAPRLPRRGGHLPELGH